jgi:hypothetical protein
MRTMWGGHSVPVAFRVEMRTPVFVSGNDWCVILIFPCLRPISHGPFIELTQEKHK